MTNPNRDDVSMDDRMPAEVELQSIGMSFTLAAGKNLSRTWQRELRTESESRFRASVTRNSLEIGFSPPLLIDAQWPAMNMQLGGVKRDFNTGQTSVFLSSIYGVAEGLIDFSDDAKKEVAELIALGVNGTAMAQRGYNPMQDPHIVATLETLADHFRAQPSSGKTDVNFRDFGSPRIEVNLSFKTDFRHIEKSAGLFVRRGTTIAMSIAGHGNLAAILASATTADKAAATNIDSVTIVSAGLLVIVNEKPIAYLDRIRIDRGGAVTLEKVRLEGVAGEAAGIESVVRLVASALQWNNSGVGGEGSATLAANSPSVLATIIPDMVRIQIEKTLTDGTKQLLRTNRAAIPDLDLEQVFLV